MRLKMIYKVIFLASISLVSCQYPRQRAPPVNAGPPAEAYADYDDYPPQPRHQPASQPAPRPTPRNSDILLPASVHYVNIGAELAGDYKFGYDTGKRNDGQSFREETRLPDGSVQGAYGYVDETGTQRIVKYRAGKDGFHVLKDGESGEAPKPAPVQQAAPQSAYRAPAQPAYRAPTPAQPAYRAPAQAQPAYRAPVQSRPVYRAPPQPQPVYREPEPVYRAQPAARPESYRPQPRSQPARSRYSPPPKESYDNSEDYDYPNNDISERRLVPIDTTLFNYNIGTTHGNKN